MGIPKRFDEPTQLTLVDGRTARVGVLLDEDDYRLDFIRTAIAAEIKLQMARTKSPKRDRLKGVLGHDRT